MGKPTPSVARQIGVFMMLLAVVTAIATLGSLATIPNTEGWYATVEKVPWNPPSSVFGPAWTVLYIVIAIAGYLIWRAGFAGQGRPNRARRVLQIYAVQLVLNGLWTPIFFAGFPLVGAVAWWVALMVILALIVTVIWLIVGAWPHSRSAALMLVPYLLWLVFASTLNLGIIVLN